MNYFVVLFFAMTCCCVVGTDIKINFEHIDDAKNALDAIDEDNPYRESIYSVVMTYARERDIKNAMQCWALKKAIYASEQESWIDYQARVMRDEVFAEQCSLINKFHGKENFSIAARCAFWSCHARFKQATLASYQTFQKVYDIAYEFPVRFLLQKLLMITPCSSTQENSWQEEILDLLTDSGLVIVHHQRSDDAPYVAIKELQNVLLEYAHLVKSGTDADSQSDEVEDLNSDSDAMEEEELIYELETKFLAEPFFKERLFPLLEMHFDDTVTVIRQ